MGLFANLPLPNPPVARPHEAPQWGQRTSFDGLRAIITWIGEKIGDDYLVKAIAVGHHEEAGQHGEHTPFKYAMGVFSTKTATIGRREEPNGSQVAQAGHEAKRGQWAVYVNEDGTK